MFVVLFNMSCDYSHVAFLAGVVSYNGHCCCRNVQIPRHFAGYQQPADPMVAQQDMYSGQMYARLPSHPGMPITPGAHTPDSTLVKTEGDGSDSVFFPNGGYGSTASMPFYPQVTYSMPTYSTSTVDSDGGVGSGYPVQETDGTRFAQFRLTPRPNAHEEGNQYWGTPEEQEDEPEQPTKRARFDSSDN